MEYVDLSEKKKVNTKEESYIGDTIRGQILEYSKDFKTSWVQLGQNLYAVYQDKYYYGWGYEKFETYVEEEVGLKKSIALKLLKTYLFLEQDEPAYLKKEFAEARPPVNVPGYEEIDVLRLAKSKKELNKDDYLQLKKNIFEKGKNAGEARKDLTAIMKERKVVDPDEEREKRNQAAIQKLVNSIRSFKKDMETLKLLSVDIVEDADKLLTKLQVQVKTIN